MVQGGTDEGWGRQGNERRPREMHRSGSIRLHRQTDQQRAPAFHAQVMAGSVTRSEGAALRLEGTGTEVEEIELRLLLDGIRLCYRYDFRGDARSPMRRPGLTAVAPENLRTVSGFQDRVLHDP